MSTSPSKSVMERRAHSDRVKVIPAGMPAGDLVDLMIESKDKEQAVFDLYERYNLFKVDPEARKAPAALETLATKGRKSAKSPKKKKKKNMPEEEDEEELDEPKAKKTSKSAKEQKQKQRAPEEEEEDDEVKEEPEVLVADDGGDCCSELVLEVPETEGARVTRSSSKKNSKA